MTMDYKELTKDFIKNYDAINTCGLHNILPDGDKAMVFLLSLEPKIFMIG